MKSKAPYTLLICLGVCGCGIDWIAVLNVPYHYLDIVTSDPPNGSAGIPKSTPIVLTFDESVATETVLRGLRLYHQDAEVAISSFSIYWSDDAQVLELRPISTEHELLPNTIYTVSLDQSVIRSAEGFPMRDDYFSSFATSENDL